MKNHNRITINETSFGTGFMSKGVTFCAMLPMRSIPFKVMCLIGLDADAFPRDFQPLSFDIMARNARIIVRKVPKVI